MNKPNRQNKITGRMIYVAIDMSMRSPCHNVCIEVCAPVLLTSLKLHNRKNTRANSKKNIRHSQYRMMNQALECTNFCCNCFIMLQYKYKKTSSSDEALKIFMK